MKTLARITGLIFVVVGIVAVVGSATLFPRDPVQTGPVEPGIFGQLFGGPDLSSLLIPLRMLVAGSLGLQGLVLVAAGQALWLVASIASKSEQSSQHLATLAAMGSLRIP